MKAELTQTARKDVNLSVDDVEALAGEFFTWLLAGVLFVLLVSGCPAVLAVTIAMVTPILLLIQQVIVWLEIKKVRFRLIKFLVVFNLRRLTRGIENTKGIKRSFVFGLLTYCVMVLIVVTVGTVNILTQ